MSEFDRVISDHVDPESLDGLTAGEIELTGGGIWYFKPRLKSNPSAEFHWRIERATGEADTDVTNGADYVESGDQIAIPTSPAASYFFLWALINPADDTAVTGGARDTLCIGVTRR